jgi:dTDP-3-amino-3,4,6-trideoxy-alpha-D-glucose transaminase
MIKFADLRVNDSVAIAAVNNVMRSGNFINGPFNDVFAKQWANECNAKYCVLTSSGTAALTATLKCTLRGRKNNIVILPALSFAATAFAAIEAGYEVVYVDVDKRGLIRWDQVEELIYQYGVNMVHAIIPVHLYGQYVDAPNTIRDHIYVIEDACQAHGIIKSSANAPVIACFSFYPSKNLGAIGDAGAVVCDNKELADRIQAYCNYGDPPGAKYVHEFQGNNMRCDHIQAAHLSIAYANLTENNVKRASQAELYHLSGIKTFATAKLNAWHLYSILVHNPMQFYYVMYEHNIETGRHYPYTLPTIAPGRGIGSYPTARYIAQHVVTLPLGPHLTEANIMTVIDTITKLYELRDDGLWHIKESM